MNHVKTHRSGAPFEACGFLLILGGLVATVAFLNSAFLWVALAGFVIFVVGRILD